jgi:hypothetical protein
MKGNRHLRERLTELLGSRPTVGVFDGTLKAIKIDFKHTIDPEPGLVTGVTCVPYALRLHGKKGYEAIARFSKVEFEAKRRAADDLFASPEFLDWLVAGNHLEPRAEEAAIPNSTLVIYRRDGVSAHAGVLLAEGRICSKWGEWPVYHHGLWEVPTIYGDDASFFKRPDEEQILKLFHNFAQYKGLIDAQLRFLTAG